MGSQFPDRSHVALASNVLEQGLGSQPEIGLGFTVELPGELLPRCHQKALETGSCLTEWEATTARAGLRAVPLC